MNEIENQSALGSSTLLPRSTELMSRRDTGLLVVDVQGKLVSMIPNHERLVWNIGRLIDAAKALELPVAATEQYPEGLGPTVESLASKIESIPDKKAFSCVECEQVFADFQTRGVYKVLVAGIEAHVCVQQTVFDLMANGFHVYLAIDAIGSRFDLDYQTAIRRMDSGGAIITTTEAAMFEWCETSAAPEFKQISALVRETGP